LIRVLGTTDTDTNLIVRYRFASDIAPRERIGEITFHTVFEYRWMSDGHEYDDFDEDIPIDEFEEMGSSLMEITGSAYKENMLANGPYGGYAQGRLGGTIREDELRHFVLLWDDYGVFTVLALNVTVSEFESTGADSDAWCIGP